MTILSVSNFSHLTFYSSIYFIWYVSLCNVLYIFSIHSSHNWLWFTLYLDSQMWRCFFEVLTSFPLNTDIQKWKNLRSRHPVLWGGHCGLPSRQWWTTFSQVCEFWALAHYYSDWKCRISRLWLTLPWWLMEETLLSPGCWSSEFPLSKRIYSYSLPAFWLDCLVSSIQSKVSSIFEILILSDEWFKTSPFL